MTPISPFVGFPPEGVQFLRELSQHNNREWFERHKQRYQDAVQAPALALVGALGERLQSAFPQISYDARTNGGSLMRIYRDTRFSADKTPYKTNVAMMFTPAGSKRMEAPGFGLQITPQHVELMTGSFSFTPAQLEAYRAAVLDDATGNTFLEAVAHVESAGAYTINGKELKQVPRGYDAAHPRAEWLKYKGLYVFAPTIPLAVAHSAELLDALMAHFNAMAPIYHWLIGAVNNS